MDGRVKTIGNIKNFTGVTLTQADLEQRQSSSGAEKITFIAGKTKFCSVKKGNLCLDAIKAKLTIFVAACSTFLHLAQIGAGI